MKSFLLGVALLAMCAYSTAVSLEGCQRGYLKVGPSIENKALRKEIKKQLGFSLKSDDTIAEFYVKNGKEKVYVVFAGRSKGGKSIALEFDISKAEDGPLKTISFDQFFNYLECEQVSFKPVPADEDH